MPADDRKGRKALRLRAHHICCLPFASFPYAERGTAYQQAFDEAISTLLSQPQAKVTVIEGVDELCQYCPLRIDTHCSSPLGNEEQVRKWDEILLKELGLHFEMCLTAGEWHALIERRTPFIFCLKCSWRQGCRVGDDL